MPIDLCRHRAQLPVYVATQFGPHHRHLYHMLMSTQLAEKESADARDLQAVGERFPEACIGDFVYQGT